MIFEHVKSFLHEHHEHEEKLCEFAEFIHCFIVDLDDAALEKDFSEKLLEFTEDVNEDIVVAVLNHIKRRDEIPGPKWTKEETCGVAKQFDVEAKLKSLHKSFDSNYWWFAMNYSYAVHHNPQKSLAHYVDLALDEMTNPNMKLKELIKKIYKKI